MRKLYFILFLILLSACRKVEIPVPVAPTNTDIFSVKELVVVDGQEIKFTLSRWSLYSNYW